MYALSSSQRCSAVFLSQAEVYSFWFTQLVEFIFVWFLCAHLFDSICHTLQFKKKKKSEYCFVKKHPCRLFSKQVLKFLISPPPPDLQTINMDVLLRGCPFLARVPQAFLQQTKNSLVGFAQRCPVMMELASKPMAPSMARALCSSTSSSHPRTEDAVSASEGQCVKTERKSVLGFYFVTSLVSKQDIIVQIQSLC